MHTNRKAVQREFRESRRGEVARASSHHSRRIAVYLIRVHSCSFVVKNDSCSFVVKNDSRSFVVKNDSRSFVVGIHLQPTLPSRLTPSSFCASTANSIGSSLKTSLQKPLTIMFTASCVAMPRWLQ